MSDEEAGEESGVLERTVRTFGEQARKAEGGADENVKLSVLNLSEVGCVSYSGIYEGEVRE